MARIVVDVMLKPEILDPQGKAEYVRIQRELSERSIELRERLLQVCERYLPPLSSE